MRVGAFPDSSEDLPRGEPSRRVPSVGKSQSEGLWLTALESLRGAVVASLSAKLDILEAAIEELRAQLATLSAQREDDGFMTIDDACQRYRISRSTLYRLLADPLFGLAKLVVRVPPPDGPVRLPKAEVDELMRAKQTKRTRRARNA